MKRPLYVFHVEHALGQAAYDRLKADLEEKLKEVDNEGSPPLVLLLEEGCEMQSLCETNLSEAAQTRLGNQQQPQRDPPHKLPAREPDWRL